MQTWYALDIEQVTQQLHTDREAGLTAAEAQCRLQQYGANELQGNGQISPPGDTHTGTPVGARGCHLLQTGDKIPADGRLTRSINLQIVVATAKAGLSKTDLDTQCPRLHEIPFTSESKRMTTLVRTPTGVVVYAKGAPEVIVNACSAQLTAHRLGDCRCPRLERHARIGNRQVDHPTPGTVGQRRLSRLRSPRNKPKFTRGYADRENKTWQVIDCRGACP